MRQHITGDTAEKQFQEIAVSVCADQQATCLRGCREIEDRFSDRAAIRADCEDLGVKAELVQ